MFYIVAKFQPLTYYSYYTLRDMIYFSSLIFYLVQTDRKRCIRAHRALAHVGSKISPPVITFTQYKPHHGILTGIPYHLR